MSKKKLIRIFAIVGLVLIAASAFYVSKKWMSKKNPSCQGCNVVIIDIDVLRADGLDCDNRRDKTPNICKLFDNSIVFTNNISHSDLTRSSFVSGLTSLYPSSHNSWNKFYNQLDTEIVTLPEVFQREGYQTNIFIDTSLAQPITTGFSEVIDAKDTSPVELLKQLENSENPFLLYIFEGNIHLPWLLSKEEDTRFPVPSLPEGIAEDVPLNLEDYYFKVAEYTTYNYKNVFKPEAIKNNLDVFESEELDIRKVTELYDRYRKSEYTEINNLINTWKPREQSFVVFFDKTNVEQVEFLRNLYQRQIEYIDFNLSEFIDKLLSKPLSDKTVVVLKSNHGDEFYEHGDIGHHNDLYYELINTPLSFMIPKTKPVEVDVMSQDIDILPTLADILGFPVISQFQGNSLTPAIADNNYQVNQFQIAQKGGGDGKAIAAYKKGKWKLIIKDFKPYELYNIIEDPKETVDLSGQFPELSNDLYNEYVLIIDSHIKYKNETILKPEFVDEEKRKRLIEEGYF